MLMQLRNWRYYTLPIALPLVLKSTYWPYERDLLLFGDSRFNEYKNKVILEATITFIKMSEKFKGSLFE